MRNYRTTKGVSQRKVATRLGISAPYMCDLELGRRNWSHQLVERYRMACDALATK